MLRAYFSVVFNLTQDPPGNVSQGLSSRLENLRIENLARFRVESIHPGKDLHFVVHNLLAGCHKQVHFGYALVLQVPEVARELEAP